MSYMKQIDMFGETAIQTLRDNWRETIENEGGRCPCCDRWGKISGHGITETMSLALLWLSRQPVDDNGFVNVPKAAPAWMLRGKTYSLLQHWHLIYKVEKNEDKTKRSDGLWQVTTKGHQFLRNELSVPRKVFIYDNTIQGFSQEEVFFEDCFGKHFDYQEVMSDSFNLSTIKE